MRELPEPKSCEQARSVLAQCGPSDPDGNVLTGSQVHGPADRYSRLSGGNCSSAWVLALPSLSYFSVKLSHIYG